MNRFYLMLLLLIILNSCSKDTQEISVIKENNQDLEMIRVFNEGYKAMNEGDLFYSAKKFLEAELAYPQSTWAPKAVLMASYAYYLQGYYSLALENLERFISRYPKSKDLVYAHYLIAICFYENIQDEKKDTAPIYKAKEKFGYILKEYPNTDFAIDAKFKLDLIEDILASKEMYIGRYYLKREKWISSLNRFKYVLEKYDKTIFAEEALHRLVEINYKIGLLSESQKYAKILGYNYQSGEWYKKTYKIFNKDYSVEISKKKKKNRNIILDKFDKLFE